MAVVTLPAKPPAFSLVEETAPRARQSVKLVLLSLEPTKPPTFAPLPDTSPSAVQRRKDEPALSVMRPTKPPVCCLPTTLTFAEQSMKVPGRPR